MISSRSISELYGSFGLKGCYMEGGRVLFIAEKEDLETLSLLSLEGVELLFCSSRNPLECLLLGQTDLIVLDCGFNFQKGISVLRGLKESRPELPVIFLNAASTEQTAVEAFREGAREYLRKPVCISLLQETITNLLMVRGGSQEKRSHMTAARDDSSGGPGDAVTTGTPSNLHRAIRYIEENLSSRISLCDLARESNLSKYHFCRLFRKHLGLSPISYVTSMRIERAKELLMREHMTVSMVSFEVGFDNPGSFIHHFKKSTGFTPNRYRAHTRKNPNEEQ